MKNLIKKRLLSDLKNFDKCDLQGLDKQSFNSGYSNGFVKGVSFCKKWIFGLLIILVLSLVFNFLKIT